MKNLTKSFKVFFIAFLALFLVGVIVTCIFGINAFGLLGKGQQLILNVTAGKDSYIMPPFEQLCCNTHKIPLQSAVGKIFENGKCDLHRAALRGAGGSIPNRRMTCFKSSQASRLADSCRSRKAG